MKRYFKHDAESNLGNGIAYMEFDGEWATRQIERYGNRWFCSNQHYHPEIGPGLADQPLPVLEFTPGDEISEDEFEKIWEEAIKNCN